MQPTTRNKKTTVARPTSGRRSSLAADPWEAAAELSFWEPAAGLDAALALEDLIDPEDPGRSPEIISVAYLALRDLPETERFMARSLRRRKGAEGLARIRKLLMVAAFRANLRMSGGDDLSGTAVLLARLIGGEILGRALAVHLGVLGRFDRRLEGLPFLDETDALLPRGCGRHRVSFEINRCMALCEAGRLDEARGALSEATRLAPPSSAALVHLLWSGAHLASASDFAAEECETAIEGLGQAIRLALQLGRSIDALLIALDLAELALRRPHGQMRAAGYLLPLLRCDEPISTIAREVHRLAARRRLTLDSLGLARSKAREIRR